MTELSSRLSQSDREQLTGWRDIPRPEVDQILPLVSPSEIEVKKVSATTRLTKTKSLATKVLDKISKIEQQIDKKCARFKVTSPDGRGSPLFQAMVRVFNERTTTVTYEHYKRALQYRQQLAEEDSAGLRLE